jgi:hypothetical protein
LIADNHKCLINLAKTNDKPNTRHVIAAQAAIQTFGRHQPAQTPYTALDCRLHGNDVFSMYL